MKRKEQIEKYRRSQLADLFKMEKELETKIADLKIKLSVGKLKNVAELKNRKRELARIKTLIREKVAANIEKEDKK